jgi:hypothetical protein
MLREKGDCACVAQMARAKIRGRGWPSPSQSVRHLWVVRTLEIHRERHLTCGTRSSILAEIKNGLSTHKAPCALLPGKGLDRAAKSPYLSIIVAVKREGPQNRHHATCGVTLGSFYLQDLALDVSKFPRKFSNRSRNAPEGSFFFSSGNGAWEWS